MDSVVQVVVSGVQSLQHCRLILSYIYVMRTQKFNFIAILIVFLHTKQ
jgi:hypothetical protein